MKLFRNGRAARRSWTGFVLIQVMLATVAAAAYAQAVPGNGKAAGPESIFLGASLDHFVDPTGRMTIEEVAGASELFKRANGRMANDGLSASGTAALWLRFTVPPLDHGLGWALVFEETRVLRAVLYIPTAGGGWTARRWDLHRDAAAGRPLLRYPVFQLDVSAVEGRTLYLQVETTGSMRAMLWLQSARAYAVSYADRSFAFGGLIGAELALFAYLLAIGLSLRDGSLLRLSGLVLAFAAYVFSDRAFLETLLFPGASVLSRVVSGPSVSLIFAAWLSFASCYLGIRLHQPRLARIASWICLLLVLYAAEWAIEVVFDVRLLRLYAPYVFLAVEAVSVGVVLSMLVYERRRTFIFLLCFLPAILGGGARIFTDVLPQIGAYPAELSAAYIGMALSLLIFGAVTSLDIQARERRLRAAAQASEARFRSFADSASDIFWETDAGGRICYVAGLERDGFLDVGAALVDSLRGQTAQSGHDRLRSLEQHLGARQPFRAVVLDLKDGSDEIRHFAFSGAPAFDARGRFLGYRGVVSDVTREQRLMERQAQQQTMAALGQLAGGIAHEINNLLHPIINLARRVRDRLGGDEQSRYQMDIVVDAGLRAREIVVGLLTAARPSPERAQRLPLREAVRRAVDAVGPIIPASVALRVELEVPGPLVPAGEVFQVLGNLVANAIDAVQGAGTVEVSLKAGEAGRSVVLSVADDGAGMDAETRRKALEPFFTTKPPAGGTGLGLPIVYGIVTGWGGAMDILSEVGHGTRIVIHVPDEQAVRAGREADAEPEYVPSFGHR